MQQKKHHNRVIKHDENIRLTNRELMKQISQKRCKNVIKSEKTLTAVVDSERNQVNEFHPDHENKQESIPITRFTQKYGTKWRWALLVHILALIKNMDINHIDKNRLSFLIEIPVTHYEKSVEEFFTELYNLVSKQCMVNIRVTPLTTSVHGPKQYEIGII